MTGEQHATGSEPLQFDRLETDSGLALDRPSSATCSLCKAAIVDEYYEAGTATLCAACRRVVEEQIAPLRGWAPFFRAVLFGIAAAVAGAIVYYGVIALANIEIGFVAILIGYMVGRAIRKATGNRGGRRYQVLAVLLTYWAVGLAYTPVMIKSAFDQSPQNNAGESQPATPAAATPASTTAREDGPPSPAGLFRGLIVPIALVLGLVVVASFALPAVVVFGSLPSGILSAVIIGFGMRQAWRMTGVPSVVLSGPYKVGASAVTS